MADVTDAHRPRVRWQRQLIGGAGVAVDVPTVPTVVLQTMRIIVVQTTDQNKNKEEMVIAVYLPTRD